MSLRVVVTGTGGRLGAAVVRHLRSLPDAFRVVAYDRKAMDLSRPEIINDHLLAVRFDALVNCAAMTGLEDCEDDPAAARQVNLLAPSQMAAICREQGARMIQVSTDYVYAGTSPGLRHEGDPLRPLGVYARTKAEAEQQVLAADPRNVAARVSWIFGPDRPSFPDQILRAAQAGKEVAAVADKFSVPSSSADLARFLQAVLESPETCGPLNLCNAGCASWQTYAQTTLDLAVELGIPLRSRQVLPLRLAEMSAFRTPRPIHTAMSPERFAHLTGIVPRPWQEALGDFLMTYHCSPSK